MSLLDRLKCVRVVFSQMTVEPIVFLNFLAMSSLAVSEHTLLYKIVCIQNFDQRKVDCKNLLNDPILEDQVQKIASTWTIFLSLSYVLPAIMAENFLGALSDLHGRKFNILLGYSGLILTIVPDLLLTAYPQVPLYILVVSNVLAGFTGYAATVMLSCMAYLADTVQDERSLTFRMTIVSICKSLGALCGAFVAGALAKFCSIGVSILLPQSILVVGFFYTLWRIPNIPVGGSKCTNRHSVNFSNSTDANVCVKKIAASQTDHGKSAAGSTTGALVSCGGLVNVFRQVVKMNQEVIKTMMKKRRYHKRVYLLLCTLTYFCYTMSELGLQHGPLMSLYVFRRPFNWSPIELGMYKGVQHSFSLAGNIFIAIVIKKFQHAKFQVTAVILLALASGFGFLLLTGLAKTGYVLYIASGIGSFSTLLVPAMKSFVARQVEPSEVGKALAINGIAADLAFVLTTLVFTNIYNATLTVFAGFVFVLGSVVVAGCLCCMAWMHFDYSKQKRRIEQLRDHCIASPVTVVSPLDDTAQCFA